MKCIDWLSTLILTRERIWNLQNGDRLLTLQEAEALTGRKVSTWRRDVFEKRIPVIHIGRRQVRIQLSVIQGMVKAGYRPAVTR
jgi:hypothetical protein